MLSGTASSVVHRLKLALVVEEGDMAAWAVALMERLVSLEEAEVVEIIERPTQTELPELSLPARMFHGLQRWLERLAWRKEDVLALQPRPVLADSVQSVGNGRLDLILHLAPGASDKTLLRRSRFGALKPGAPLGSQDAYKVAGFWEVLRGQFFLRAQLLHAEASRPDWQVLIDSSAQALPISVMATRNQLYNKIAALIIQTIRHIHANAQIEHEMDEVPAEMLAMWKLAVPKFSLPSAYICAKSLVIQVFRLANEMIRRASVRPQWKLLLTPSGPGELALDKAILFEPAAETMIADPHLIEVDDTTYLFVEEMHFRDNRGFISAYRLTEELKAIPLGPVITEPHHLSFPCVFRHGADIYMMPEASEARVIPLYRAVELPVGWRFERNMMHDVYAVDSTLFERDGRLWLFTTVSEFVPCSGDLYVYSASDLTGPWLSHPKNPVRRGVFGARGAGTVFAVHGRLFRPGQDCSIRYGYATRVYEITALSLTEYKEHEIAVIEPNKHSGNIATHTLNYSSKLAALDGLFPSARHLSRPPAAKNQLRQRYGRDSIIVRRTLDDNREQSRLVRDGDQKKL